jgi:hypothetical protein
VYWIGFPVVACLGLAGLALIGRDGRTWSLPLLFALINMLAVVAFFCPGRYRLPVVPVLILLSAAGLARLPELWRAGARRTLGAYAVVALLAIVFLATNPPDRAVHWRETEGMAHHNLAVHYAQAAQSDPAARTQVIEQMQAAVRLRPNDSTMHTALGMWLLKFGRPRRLLRRSRGRWSWTRTVRKRTAITATTCMRRGSSRRPWHSMRPLWLCDQHGVDRASRSGTCWRNSDARRMPVRSLKRRCVSILSWSMHGSSLACC